MATKKRAIPRARTGPPVTAIADEATWAAVLSRVREGAGVTRSEMARLLGAAPPAVTRAEGGRQVVTERLAKRYAAALGLEVRLVFSTPEKKRKA